MKDKWDTGDRPNCEDAYKSATFMRMVTGHIRSEVFGVIGIQVSFEEDNGHIMVRVIGLCNGRRLSINRYIDMTESSRAKSNAIQIEVDEMISKINKSSLELRSNQSGLMS